MDETGINIDSSTFSAQIMDETLETGNSSTKTLEIMDETGKTGNEKRAAGQMVCGSVIGDAISRKGRSA